jgi:predicted secreted protein
MMWKVMLSDKRSGKIAIVAHCILNQNSRALGLAKKPSAITEVIEFLIRKNIGIIQMPCPEMAYNGLSRPPRTKDQYDNVIFREHCRKIAEEIAKQIQEYFEAGVKAKIIVGVDGSPSCCVTNSGILIEELRSALKKRKIELPFYGIRYESLSEDIAELEKLIRD